MEYKGFEPLLYSGGFPQLQFTKHNAEDKSNDRLYNVCYNVDHLA